MTDPGKDAAMVLLVVAAAVVACCVAIGWAWARRDRGVSYEADRFSAARTMTNRWAQDPMSAPKPVLDIARGGAADRMAAGRGVDEE